MNDYYTDIQRAQKIRLLDIFIIGPTLIIIGLLSKNSLPVRIILISIGIGTIFYNGYFYLKYKS